MLEFASEKFNLELVELVFSKETTNTLLKYNKINCLYTFNA